MTAALIFDLDGTLIDSAPDLHAASSRMLAREGLPALSLETVRSFIGNGIPVLVDRIIAVTDLTESARDRLIPEFVEDYEAHATDLTRPYPGVVDALRRFMDQGLLLAICTNKPEAPARTILKDLDLAGYFSTIAGGDSFASRKPDPHGVLTVAAQLGRPRTLYVGDSEVDAETAKRAGLPFLLFTGGYRKSPVDELEHAKAFDTFDALPGIVDSLCGVEV